MQLHDDRLYVCFTIHGSLHKKRYSTPPTPTPAIRQLPSARQTPGFSELRQLETAGPVADPVVLHACAIATSGSVA